MTQPGVSFLIEPILMAPKVLPTAVALFVGYTKKGELGPVHKLHTYADYEAIFGKGEDCARAAALRYTVMHHFDNDGGYCYVASLGPYSSMRSGEDAKDKLAQAIARADFNGFLTQAREATLLAAPDMVLLSLDAKDDAAAQVKRWTMVWKALLDAAAGAPGVFALLDAPDDVTLTRQCLDSLTSLTADDVRAHGAVYWPRLQTDYRVDASFSSPDMRDDVSQWAIVPPSGAIAAAIAKTDCEQGVWKAPANVALAHTIRPYCNDWRDADPLFDEGDVCANLIRSFTGRGVRVWGCRTLATSGSVCRYVQIRRTLSAIEAGLTELGRFTVFEPNTEFTWMTLKGLMRAWLHEFWRAGGLHGASEADAFKVAVGLDESMSVDDIRDGCLIVNVKVALQYPAEFIEVQLQFRSSEAGPVELTPSSRSH